MSRSSAKGYLKAVSRASINYAKRYVRDIIEEVNIKSVKKYKYNFLFEFMGSFVFAFFISIYMLNSNFNEEYIIRHTTQINPYKNSDIFMSSDDFFIDDSNNIMYDEVKKDVDKYPYNNVLLGKQTLQENQDTNFILRRENEEMRKLDANKSEKEMTNEKNEDSEVSSNLETIIRGDDKNGNLKEEAKEKNEGENIAELSFLENENNNETDEVNAKNLQEKEKQEMVKDVEKIVFKDDINKYSKIKIADIDHINLDDIDQYEILKHSKKNSNGKHIFYTVLGCLIYVLFVVCGAHINPAYTYALWFLEPKKYGFVLSTLYVFFQYVGGVLASILCAHIYGSIFIYTLLPKKKIMKTFMCESICTFVMTLILINLYQYKKNFLKENKKEEFDYAYGHTQIRNVASSTNLFDDIYDYDVSNMGKFRRGAIFRIENKYVKYAMNHMFYILFIFFALLFFVFVTNTTLNPMFSTSTLYTYLYFKLFRSSKSVNICSFLLSFLSFRKIVQLVILYIQSLPFWIGPYVGSTLATYLIIMLKNEDGDDVNVIDTNVYRYNNKREKLPLMKKCNYNDNAYLMEYNDNINQNINAYSTPAVF